MGRWLVPSRTPPRLDQQQSERVQSSDGERCKAAPAARGSLVEHVSALLGAWVAIGRGVAVTGNIAHAALAAVVELRKLRLLGAPAWWLWGFAHVLLLAGGRNRAAVVLNWLWAYLTFGRGTRLITGSAMDG